MRDKYIRYLVFVIFVGAALRLLWLGKVPGGFFRDEAALGYNSFSIWQTGKDEYGQIFPLVFRSFEVFFLPAYVYISAPIIGILGLSEFSTRLLSSLSGVSTLILAYYISKEIWNRKAALFTTIVLTISPWQIFYSRGAFEGNLALAFFSAGFLFWLKFFKLNKVRDFFLSTLFFAFSMYSYQAERVAVPIFALIAAYLAREYLLKLKSKLFKSMLIVFIILAPLLYMSFKVGGYHRAYGVSIFTKDNPPGWVEGEGAGVLINNKTYLRFRQISSLYLSYLSPRNLFVEQDANRQRSVENYSVMYAWTFPFLIYGVFIALRKRSVGEILLFSWAFIAPLPAALTGDPFHTYRSLLLYFPLTLFVGLGIGQTYSLVKQKFRTLFISGVLFISTTSLAFYLFDYVVITQATHARAWDYGYKEIIMSTKDVDAEKIVIDDIGTESYIHFLFYRKTDPGLYHLEVSKLGNLADYYYTNPDIIRPVKFGKYEFREVDWAKERGDTGTVFVMTPDKLPESEFINDPKIMLFAEIKYPDGKIAYRIVKRLDI